MSVIHPIILSGGAGSRLWPLSRGLFPKQLLALTSERSLIQETVARTVGDRFGRPFIVCNVEHRFLIAEQMREAGWMRQGCQEGQDVKEKSAKRDRTPFLLLFFVVFPLLLFFASWRTWRSLRA